MKSILVVLLVLFTGSATAAADTDFAIEPLHLVVRLPDSAGEWAFDPSRSEPGKALVHQDASINLFVDDAAPDRSCQDLIAGIVNRGATATTASAQGLGWSWTSDAALEVQASGKQDMLTLCADRGGRQLLGILAIPKDASSLARMQLLVDALAAAWNDRVDGVQRLRLDEYELVVPSRDALWFHDSSADPAFLRSWAEPRLMVTFERNQLSGGMITADDSQTCASWMEALGGMYTVSSGATYLPDRWHGETGLVVDDDGVRAVACLPRQGGGTILAQILYGGDPATGDFELAVRPLLAALADAAGIPPAVVETPFEPSAVDEPAYVEAPPERGAGVERDPYDAYQALLVTASYLRLAPTIDGVAPGAGFALAVDRPALPADAEVRFAWVWTGRALAGYDPEAGVVADARIAGGYHFGSSRAAWILLGGAGADMIDHGDEAAPFHARLAAYAYVGAIFRFAPSERLTLEVQPATLQRAGVYEELEVTGRATIRRGGRRKVSIDVGWRRYSAEGMQPDAQLFSVGLGVGL